jgi:hypothetical protein
MPAPAYWTRPDVAEAIAGRVEVLSAMRAVQGDLQACPPLQLLSDIRRRGICVDLYIETESGQWRLRLDGDRLQSIQPAVTGRPRFIAELLVDIGAIGRANMEAFLRGRVVDPDRAEGREDVGRALVEAGLVTEEQLAEAKRVRAMGYLADVCLSRVGQFVMRWRQRAGDEAEGETHSVCALLLVLLRRGVIARVLPASMLDVVATEPVTAEIVRGLLTDVEAALLSRCRTPVQVGETGAEMDVVLRLRAVGALVVVSS